MPYKASSAPNSMEVFFKTRSPVVLKADDVAAAIGADGTVLGIGPLCCGSGQRTRQLLGSAIEGVRHAGRDAQMIRRPEGEIEVRDEERPVVELELLAR